MASLTQIRKHQIHYYEGKYIYSLIFFDLTIAIKTIPWYNHRI